MLKFKQKDKISIYFYKIDYDTFSTVNYDCIYFNGNRQILHIKRGKAHRVNKPAEYGKNKQLYYCYTYSHSVRGPSHVYGLKPRSYQIRYYVYDKYNRYYGSSDITYKNGIKTISYYKNGLLHRDDGPAVIKYRGSILCEKYLKNNILHRDDGPAIVEYRNGFI